MVDMSPHYKVLREMQVQNNSITTRLDLLFTPDDMKDYSNTEMHALLRTIIVRTHQLERLADKLVRDTNEEM